MEKLTTPKIEGWTEARYWTFIRSLLRKGWSKYPVKYQVLKEARRPAQLEDKRIKWEYQCRWCEEWWVNKKVGKRKSSISVDHIKPCGTLKCYEDLVPFCSTLFCGKDNLQVLCHICHDIKTYMDKYGWTKKEAIEKKEVIQFLNTPIDDQKKYLKTNGFSDSEISNQDKRAESFMKLRRKDGIKPSN